MCVAEPFDSYVLRDPVNGQRKYREIIEDVTERDYKDNNIHVLREKNSPTLQSQTNPHTHLISAERKLFVPNIGWDIDTIQ